MQDVIGDSGNPSNSAFANMGTLLRGKRSEKVLAFFVLINLLVLYTRPQSDLKILTIAQVPFLLSIPLIVGWLARANRLWTAQMKIMALFFVQGAILIPFATNNRMAFEGARILLQLFAGMMFPLILFCSNGVYLRKCLKILAICSIYLTIYCVRTGGTGPGDHIGDENDLCLAFLVLLGLQMPFLSRDSYGNNRFITLITVPALLAGIILTQSRGGFLGLLAILGYFFLRSKNKIFYIVVILLIAGAGAMFVPQDYWDDMSTIQQTDQGTAKARRELWKVAVKIFQDPKNIIWGIGMQNVPYRLGDYEPAENKLDTGKSIDGRAVHSLYFELLPELGSIGIALFVSLLWTSIRGNRRAAQRIQKQIGLLERRLKRRPSTESKLNPDSADTRRAIKTSIEELSFLSSTIFGINAAWMGLLASGAFISVLYYPPMWLLAALSSATQVYQGKFDRFFEENPEILNAN